MTGDTSWRGFRRKSRYPPPCASPNTTLIQAIDQVLHWTMIGEDGNGENRPVKMGNENGKHSSALFTTTS